MPAGKELGQSQLTHTKSLAGEAGVGAPLWRGHGKGLCASVWARGARLKTYSP